MKQPAIAFTHVYYITHYKNLPLILRHGVLSQKRSEELPDYIQIYDEAILNKRQAVFDSEGNSLREFAHFYFNARNPLLYRLCLCERRKVAVIRMKAAIFRQAKYIAIGDAAAAQSEIIEVSAGVKALRLGEMRAFLYADSWGAGEDKRIIMSELLVPERVSPDCIDMVYVPSHKMKIKLRQLTGNKLRLAQNPDMFFKPNRGRRLPGTEITLVRGDIFFSRMQTLTIPVNTVGVMGGGLAARAKYNFPHLYVKFQDLCRSKALTARQPFLYKESYSYDGHMAADPGSLRSKPNDEKWFLLFATKENWRNPARLQYIEDGLGWLLENAERSGVKSLALPALGCGLGGLSWEQVGPVMCRALHRLSIPCAIYLPRENDVQIPEGQLRAEFLLGVGDKEVLV